MDSLHHQAAIALPARQFCGIAFDGFFYYITSPSDHSVSKFTQDFTLIDVIRVGRLYRYICYDSAEKCFWGTAREHSDTIYRLDGNMKETGRLCMLNSHDAGAQVTGISCGNDKDTLLVAYTNYIAEVCKCSGEVRVVQCSGDGIYQGVLLTSQFYAAIWQYGTTQQLHLYSRGGCLSRSLNLPASYCVKGVLLRPCHNREQGELSFVLLAETANCCPCVLFYRVQACYDDMCDCCTEAHCTPDAEEQECPTYYRECYRVCRPGDSPEPGGGEVMDTDRSVCDVIESIAQMELSLSVILNSEGEKLQKAVALANSVDELLAVNKSVTRTISDCVQLEHVLCAKLETLNGLCVRPTQNQNN